MKVGTLQFAPRFGEVEENIAEIERLALDRGEGLDLLVVPELATTGYLFASREELASMAESFPDGPSVRSYARIARKLDAVVVGGFAEREGERIFNSAALLRPDGTAELYRKTHLFMDEKRIFDPGDLPFGVVVGAGVRIGMMICFDWYYPEVARILALAGAEVICHPSNLVLPHCPESMKTRALENRVFAITANRIGSDRNGGKELRFIGMSQIVSPMGRVLARAPEEDAEVTIVEIDPSEARNKDLTGKNVWTEDRRVDLYGPLA